jgi:hypothetical protein
MRIWRDVGQDGGSMSARCRGPKKYGQCATLPWPSQPWELGQCWLQLRSNLSQLALHSDLPQLTMHCSCSSGSAHCALQAFAFVRQFVSQSPASLNLVSPARERPPARDGAPLVIISATKMQVIGRKVFMDALLAQSSRTDTAECVDRFSPIISAGLRE